MAGSDMGAKINRRTGKSQRRFMALNHLQPRAQKDKLKTRGENKEGENSGRLQSLKRKEAGHYSGLN
jgi:hypothetical protein